MKVGVYTTALKEYSFEDMLKKVAELGMDMVELPCGGESGFGHCRPSELLADENKYNEFIGLLNKYGVKVSALSCHGNPIAPNKEEREADSQAMKDAVLLAERMGLDTIVCFSGLCGDHEGATKLNWATVNHPKEYSELYKWQWENVLVPYWKEFVQFAREHHVTKIGFELHPGEMCFNPRSLKRLRAEVGPEIGCNLDLSHLLWQGMDPILVIQELKGMIYHFHAKDIGFDPVLMQVNGLVNTDYFHSITTRSWNFRTVGMGHGVEFWRNVFAELKRAGYNYVASIEMECEVLDMDDGLKKAVKFLRDNVIADDNPEAYSFQRRVQRGWVKHLKEMDEDLKSLEK